MSTPAREYHTQQVHYLRKVVTFADDATAVTVGVIPANSVVVRVLGAVTTAFDDTGTDLLDIGTSADPDAYAVDLDVASVGVKINTTIATAAAASVAPTADTTVTATFTGSNTDAAAGSVEVIVEYIPDNDG